MEPPVVVAIPCALLASVGGGAVLESRVVVDAITSPAYIAAPHWRGAVRHHPVGATLSAPHQVTPVTTATVPPPIKDGP
jgi:hypothetical protein